MKREVVLIVGFVLCFAVAFASVNASNVEVVQVGALSEQMLTFNLKSGQKFTGSLAISGGSGNDIDFWITNPLGATILNLGRVSQGRSFDFTAQASGAYTLHFGNTFSWFTSKTVYLTYDVGFTILGIDAVQLLIIVGVVLILLVVALAILLNRRKRMSKTNQPPPSSPQLPTP